MKSAVEVKRRRRNERRNWWVKPWIKLQPISGAYSALIEDLMNSDRIALNNYFRMEMTAFKEFLSHVEHDINKRQTKLPFQFQPLQDMEKPAMTSTAYH